MRNQLQSYFERNNLIPKEHHGGLKGHSTLSCIANVDFSHKHIKERKKCTAILATDLSAAFDMIDHSILIKKLKHYGISNNAASLIESFLSNRKCFVEIQGHRSKTKTCPPCSVIQGSKLSGFMYTIYSIEVPLLPKIMKDQQLAELLLEIRIPQYYGINHQTSQFVDDSTNIVGTENFNEMNRYLNDFHNLLESYYHMNKLRMNAGKTKTIVTKNNELGKRISIKTKSGDTVQDDKALKILGFIRNTRDNHEAHLGMVSSIVSNKLTELRPYLKFMNMKSRRETLYSKVASIITHGLELYAGATQWTLQKVTALMMRCNRAIYMRDYMLISNTRICNAISVDPPLMMCRKASVKLIQKILRSEKQKQICDKIKFNSNPRKGFKKKVNKETITGKSKDY